MSEHIKMRDLEFGMGIALTVTDSTCTLGVRLVNQANHIRLSILNHAGFVQGKKRLPCFKSVDWYNRPA